MRHMKAQVRITGLGKVCTRCGIDKPLVEYGHEASGTLGLRAECKKCWAVRVRNWYEANRERKHAAGTRWRKANPDRVAAIARRQNLRRKYGITPEVYDAMLADQGGRCAGCGSTDSGDCRFNTFHVDHDHQTGKIRGLLCASCNRALGVLNDDPDRFMALATYLLQQSDLLGTMIGCAT